MLDEVAGIAVFSLGRDHFFTSINLQVDFLRPAQMGERVSVLAEVIRAGQRIIHVETQMRIEDKLLAKADTNLITTDQKLPQFG
jgi:acyl-coenzyme A thioesterase PaaI-like protein